MAQQGYMLIVIMFSMLGISVTLLGSAPMFWHSSSALEQREVLANAKSALVSYAVNYVDLYGPRGAGLGHFPCPDTDNNARNTSWHYDGPNPPCGTGLVAIGNLPRHLTGLTGRFSFHQQSTQRLQYSVSTRYINNPSNRVVNPDTKSDYQAFSDPDVVARISYPKNANNAEHTISVKRRDIQQATLRRAAEWVASKLPVNLQHTHFTYAKDCRHLAKLAILYWLSSEPSWESDCETLALALRENTFLLEGVPYPTHWFFRNQWYNYVKVEMSAACSELAMHQCRWWVEYSQRDNLVYIQRVPLAG